MGVTEVLATHRRAIENGNHHRALGQVGKYGDYEGVYSLLTHEEETTATDAFLYGLTVILMMKMVCETDNRLKASFDALVNGSAMSDIEHFDDIASLGDVLLRHMLQLICNASAITAVVSDSPSKSSPVTSLEEQVRIATAIFPQLSLLNHSCDPNVIVSYVGTTVTAKSTRPIRDGQQVYNCYGPHFARMGVKDRRIALQQQYHFYCRCHKCETEGTAALVDKMKDDRDPVDDSRALNCPECRGPMNMGSFTCGSCHHSLGSQQSKDVKLSLEGLLRKKKVLKKGIASGFGKDEAASLIADAERLLHKNNLDLAEFYDLYAFILTNHDDMRTALKFVKKDAVIVKAVYGDASVEYAYELRKISELSSNLGDFRFSIETARKSKKILETCYSSDHRDVKELAETIKQLEIVRNFSCDST